jgi:hypothetical protein
MTASGAATTQTWITLGILVLVLVAIAAWAIARKQRSDHLRSRFGPEYDRVIHEQGDRRRAEAVLETREKRVERFHIRPLTPADRDRFAGAWRAVQARFVDDPKGAVTEADRLVAEVMSTRGYPVSDADFERRAEYVSVDHPHLVENYRAAAQIAQRHARDEATTEELRRAMVHYRALFDDLLEVQEAKR